MNKFFLKKNVKKILNIINKENIISVEAASQRVRIFLKNSLEVNLLAIQKLPIVKGIFQNSNLLVLVVGDLAKDVQKIIQKLI